MDGGCQGVKRTPAGQAGQPLLCTRWRTGDHNNAVRIKVLQRGGGLLHRMECLRAGLGAIATQAGQVSDLKAPGFFKIHLCWNV